MIPIIGNIYYIFSFFFNFILIGLRISQHGILFAFSKLWHFPFEIFSLSISFFISYNWCYEKIKKVTKKKFSFEAIICSELIAFIILFFAAYNEGSL